MSSTTGKTAIAWISPPSTGPTVKLAPIGLTREYERIDGALQIAASGSTRVVLIEGDLGSGRSTLLRASREMAEARSMRVLSTQGRRTDHGVGYSCLLTLLSGLEGDLDELAGPHAVALRSALSLATPEIDPLDVGLGLFRTVSALAERSPVAILVDDFHLVDAPTAEALSFALGRLDADAVVAVMTVPSAAAARIADVAHLIVTIAPLAVTDLVEIAGRGSDVERDVLIEVCEQAAGNPLVAVALAQSLTEGQRSGHDSLPRVPKPPEALVRQFESVVSDLGDHARRTLVVVAADTEGDRTTIEAALDRLGEPRDGLREAARAGLIVFDGSHVRIGHPLLEEYAYLQVGVASRRAAHRALAEELSAPSQAASRVWQLAFASDGPDDGLAEALDLVASDASRRSDPASAARALVRGAELSTRPADSRRRRRQAAKLAFEAGYVDEALDHLDGADPGEASAAEFSAVRQRVVHWSGGETPVGHLPGDSDDRELAAADAMIAEAERDLLEGRNSRLIELDSTSVHWDPCELLVLRSRALLATGLTTAAESLTAVRLAALGDRRSVVAAVIAAARAEVLVVTGDLAGAARLTDWSRPLLQDEFLESHLAGLDHTIGRSAMARGDFEGAVAALEKIPVSEMHRAVADLVVALLRMDDPAAARAWCQRVPPRDELVPRIRRKFADGLLGEPDEIEKARRLATDFSLPMEVAGALVVEGEWLRINGEDDAASAVEARARAHLRPVGARYPLASPGGQDTSPEGTGSKGGANREVVDALSPAELRVAVSVATGRTNKEAAADLYISVKTVDFHLQNTYRKLGLRSRTELAVLMIGTSPT